MFQSLTYPLPALAISSSSNSFRVLTIFSKVSLFSVLVGSESWPKKVRESVAKYRGDKYLLYMEKFQGSERRGKVTIIVLSILAIFKMNVSIGTVITSPEFPYLPNFP